MGTHIPHLQPHSQFLGGGMYITSLVAAVADGVDVLSPLDVPGGLSALEVSASCPHSVLKCFPNTVSEGLVAELFA